MANCLYLSLLGIQKLTGSSESLKKTSQVEGDVSILEPFQLGGSDFPEQNLPVFYHEKCKPFENLAAQQDGGLSLQYLELHLIFSIAPLPSTLSGVVLPLSLFYPIQKTRLKSSTSVGTGVALEMGLGKVGGEYLTAS